MRKTVKNDPTTSSLAVGKGDADIAEIDPEQRTMVKISIGGKLINFLYDTGSQFMIITKKTYERLANKPPLMPIGRNGSRVDGHKFSFEGMT